MNATFHLNGYDVQVTSDGHLVSPDPASCHGTNRGHVGVQLIAYNQVVPQGQAVEPKSVAMLWVKPSQARAVASAILSAATEASRYQSESTA